MISKITGGDVPKEIDFELFVRTVAIILEENNKLPDDAIEEMSDDEYEIETYIS